MDPNGEGDSSQRRSTRPNFGLPPLRLIPGGTESEPIVLPLPSGHSRQRKNADNVIPEMSRVSKPPSVVSSVRSLTKSVHSSHESSYSSKIRRKEAELDAEMKEGELDKELEVMEMNLKKCSTKVKSVTEEIESIKCKLDDPATSEEDKVELLQEKKERERELKTLFSRLDDMNIDFEFQKKFNERTKKILRREIEILMEKIDEQDEQENDDVISVDDNRTQEWANVGATEFQSKTYDYEPFSLQDRIEIAEEDKRNRAELDLLKAQAELSSAEENRNKSNERVAAASAHLKTIQSDTNPNEIKMQTVSPDEDFQLTPLYPHSPMIHELGHERNLTSKFLARQSTGKDLPYFSGRAEEWISFFAAYNESTKICGFSASENMERLRKCLKGDAAKAVQCLMVSPLNLPEVLEVLQMHFGQTEHIIEALIIKAKSVPVVKMDQISSLIEFGTSIRNLAATMRNLNCNDHLSNPILLKDMESKLPATMQIEYREWLSKDLSQPRNILTFSDWLKNKTRIACSICPSKLTNEDTKKPEQKKQEFRNNHMFFKPRRNGEHALAATPATDEKKKPPFKKGQKFCHQCDMSGHRLQDCSKFAALPQKERTNLVYKKRLCLGCLFFGHTFDECRSKKPCNIEDCTREHHVLLHRSESQIEENKKIESVAHANQEAGQILYQIAPVTLCGPTGNFPAYVILDSCSGITTMDSSTADALGLKGKNVPLSFNGLTDSVTVTNSKTVELDIISKNNEKFHLSNVKTVDKLRLPQKTVTKKALSKWKHLRGLDIATYENARPVILIGQDHADLITPFMRSDGPPNAPIATLTKLGWVLNGRLPPTLEVPRDESVLLNYEEDWDYLHQLMKQHYSIEDFGVKVTAEKPRSKEDRRAESLMTCTLKRVGERYEAGLLWKEDNLSLPSSKENAMKRLITMERKMDRDPEFAQKYCDKFLAYERSGFIQKLTPDEIIQGGSRTWYLPHFGVTKESKPGKIRLVFDAAAKSNGCSLNDHLLKGPDNLTPLTTVLFKFRERAIGITGDIKEMYHQVKMRSEDQDSQRFLWRGMDRKRDPDVYKLPVMFFGAACSPSLAQEAKNRNAMEWQKEFPDAANAIVEKNYVDDFLASKDTPEETIKLFKDVFEINRRGGFHICNWICSSLQVMQAIPEELRASSVKTVHVNPEDSLIERILGLHWMPQEDLFTFLTQFHKIKKGILQGEEIPTKREALSLLMSIYDPLGFLGHFTVKAKILLQDTWRTGIGWDDELPSTIHVNWRTWIEELRNISNFKMPRCYSLLYSSSQNIQLHVFCDASESAFAAVAYFRIKNGDQVEVGFVSSKTRVAPLKPLSIPRMELQAAVMGCRLAQTIKDKHEIKPHRTVFWTDSRTVMCWLRSDGRRFQQFVSHRIGEIQEVSEVTEWNWIPTLENVADEATRNVCESDLTPGSRWLNGPSFLRFDEEYWPQEKKSENEVTPEELELKRENICKITPIEPLIDPNKFSSWTKLIKVTAYVQRFVKCCMDSETSRKGLRVTPEDMREAANYWFKLAQSESFASEIKNIKSGKELERDSKLLKSSPFMDQDGLLKVQGRLNAAECLIKTARNPVILDPKHQLTKLLINYYHEAANHHGQERVTNEIRQQFHILNLRTAVRSSWTHCQKCKNDRAEPSIPQMGQLPSCRLQANQRPFTITGMDYFGPMEVTVGRHHEKRYGALFTCMATRAVHLEIAHSLSTDSCIMAIRRFMSRRGNPDQIHSDNGTNFKGANNELKAALLDLDQKKIQSTLTNHGIQWFFIPPAAPHMGGSWERLVKSVKVALHATLNERYPKDEVLLTLMTEAEHAVNSRPLTHVPMDPDDEEALTPNHFLLGASSNLQPPGLFDDADLSLQRQWRKAQRLADHFWQRWIQEYLPSLLTRSKWNEKRPSARVGDVAIIVDPRMPRNSWPKGIVEKTFPGKDGEVRVVEVATKLGTYRRPI